MTELEPGDRPISILGVLPARRRDFHEVMIVEIMKVLRDIYPEVTWDWEETP